MNEQHQLKATIAFLESRRSTLSDIVVDAAIAPLQRELDAHISNSRERRKQVTVLFADISNFTGMSETMDAEDVRNIVESLWERIDNAIIEHGGSIDKHIGDAVMALWGIEQTREDDPERAVRAALAMQRAVRDWRTEMAANSPEIAQMDPPISVRIGINTGAVILGLVGTTREFTAIGDTVNTASRVETAAPLGNILISHSTYLHVRGLFELREREPIAVKGKAKKLATYLVQRAKPQQFKFEQQEVEGVKTPLIGRVDDLTFLQEHFFEAILENRPQLITIAGEAGIGKSRLIFEFNSWMESQSWRTSYFKARARQETMGRPYNLLRELLLQRFDVKESDSPEVVQNKLELGFFNEWEPESDIQERTHLIATLVGCPPVTSRYINEAMLASGQWQVRAREYLTEFFKAVSFTEPTAFLIEDIHWADHESLELIQETVASSYDQILMIICTTRPSFLQTYPAWCEDNSYYSQHTLGPLSEEESKELISEILYKAVEIPEEIYEMIASRAEGNPYHIEEFIKMLVNDQVILKNEEHWLIRPELLAQSTVPTTLTSMLEARLDSIPPLDLKVLQCASVIGQTFWADTIKFMLERTEEGSAENVAEGLASLVESGLIMRCNGSVFEHVEEYTFKNLLLQQVCYERILKRERRILHELTANWIVDAKYTEPEFKIQMVLNHYSRGNCNEKALIYLAQESRKALVEQAYAKAVRILDTALTLIKPDEHEWHQKFISLRQQAQIFLTPLDKAPHHESIESTIQSIEESINNEAEVGVIYASSRFTLQTG